MDIELGEPKTVQADINIPLHMFYKSGKNQQKKSSKGQLKLFLSSFK
jgi:hypothetical protein